jgi:hypothetical protein
MIEYRSKVQRERSIGFSLVPTSAMSKMMGNHLWVPISGDGGKGKEITLSGSMGICLDVLGVFSKLP